VSGPDLPALPEPAITGFVHDSVMRQHSVFGFTADQMHAYARAALAAQQPAAVPAGMALVPLEPTREMDEAAYRRLDAKHRHLGYELFRVAYRAMLAAAPAVQPATDLQRECDAVDFLLQRLGLDPERCRTEGGAINLGRVKTMLDEQPAEPVARTLERCPECYRPKARNADDCMAGCCSKWYAVRDPEAADECKKLAAYWRAAPAPAAMAQPLTDEQIDAACGPCYDSDMGLALRREFIQQFRRVYERLHSAPGGITGDPKRGAP
jgi:hypothetical protein